MIRRLEITKRMCTPEIRGQKKTLLDGARTLYTGTGHLERSSWDWVKRPTDTWIRQLWHSDWSETKRCSKLAIKALLQLVVWRVFRWVTSDVLGQGRVRNDSKTGRLWSQYVVLWMDFHVCLTYCTEEFSGLKSNSEWKARNFKTLFPSSECQFRLESCRFCCSKHQTAWHRVYVQQVLQFVKEAC